MADHNDTDFGPQSEQFRLRAFLFGTGFSVATIVRPIACNPL
jgi:hypothetical protein